MGNIIAIVGRPNVGKSTLFNRITGTRDAIVDETEGVTRDRHYGRSEWNGIEFSVIDTGGYVPRSADIFEDEIRKQVHLAIAEADLILFMVDVTVGITDLDESMAGMLRKTRKKVVLVVNKVDNNQRIYEAQEFHKLGIQPLFCVSCLSGSGTGDLLDEAVKDFTPGAEEAEDPDIPRFTIVGRPNVGKSSLLNTLIGEERNIVTPVSGTTRDSIETRYRKFRHDFYLVDTAGLRKKGKVQEDLEFYSVMRSIRAIEKSDVCFLMLDATRGMESQDLNIFELIRKNRKGVVIVVNKWDLIEKDHHTHQIFKRAILEKTAPFQDIPIFFISAIHKQRILQVLEKGLEVFRNRSRRIPTSKLNEVMLEAIARYEPPSVKGKFVKIKYVTQLHSPTPAFAFFCNLPQYIREPYKRYLENQLRQHFSLTGVPVQIYFRAK
ncbi:MAG TPA: ribosome biogenesis GTPase Der [Bacteroidetes bacterium]|nr:ribosome biogenesis GTPase Der [Bacteroidota bacterium]